MNLNNIPFLVKVSFGPTIALILLIFVSYLGNSTNKTQSEALQRVVEVDYKQANDISEISSQFRQLNANVFQALVKEAADEPGRLSIVEELANLGGSAQSIADRIRDLANSFSDTSTKDSLLAQADEMSRYGEAVVTMGEFLEIDFSLGVGNISEFEEFISGLLSELESLQNAAGQRAVDQYREASDESSSASNLVFWVTVLAVILAASASIIISFMIRRSINTIADSTLQLASGELNVDINSLKRKDELGEIVKALQIFRDGLQENEKMRVESEQVRKEREAEERKRVEEEQRASEEELKRQQKEKDDRKEMLNNLAEKFDEQVNGLLNDLEKETNLVSQESNTMSTRMEQSVESSNILKSSSDKIQGDMQTVAAATEEMSGSVHEISRQVNEASEISSHAVSEAE